MIGNSSIKEQKIGDKVTLKVNDSLLTVLGKNYFDKQKNENYINETIKELEEIHNMFRKVTK